MNVFNVDFDDKTSTLWVGNECGSGAVYTDIKTTEQLKTAVNKYIDDYVSISVEKEDVD